MEWIYIIAIGFICVMYPIALLICVFLMPWYVILAYFIWITISIILISKLQTKTAITVTVVLTVVFTIVFCTAIHYSQISSMYNEEKLKLLPYIMPALNLPAIFYFGFKAKRKSEESKVNKLSSAKQDAIKSIDKTIKNKTVVLQLISETERDYRSVSDLLCLLSLLDKTTGNTLVGKYNSIQNDSFSKARTNIMLKLPDSEKADFPNDYSDLSRYKSTIEKERQELNRYKESIHSCNSAIEIKKTMKNLKKVTQ